MTPETVYFKEQKLRVFTEQVFEAMGCSIPHTKLAADVLIKADKRGIDSHGVARLSGYCRLWEAGRINTKPSFSITKERTSTANLDADSGLGLVSGPYAMELAISKARKTGVGIVTVNNSNHFGIGCYHGMLASSQQMIGVCMTNASPLVAPTNGKSRMLGTNPITVVIPALNNPPFVADLATSAAANGKLELLQRKNLSAPAGWMQDAEGMPSNDPHILKHGGALIGLGSTPDTGMHKGYCLGAFVDIFSGVLSGANYGPWVPPFVSFLPLVSNPVGKGIGHFFMAIDIDAFRDRIEFLEHMDRWMDAFKSSEPIHKDEPVMIPGEPEFKQEIIRSENGIPLLHTVVLDLEDLGQKLGIDFTP